MRKVLLEEALGWPLAHDVTEINPETGFKGPAFRRGHVITAGDLERLRSLGKNTVFLQEPEDTDIHEDDAALQVAPLVAGENILHDPAPSEGKIAFKSACAGVFTVDAARLFRINALAVPALPTLRTGTPVVQGLTVATFRIIPLTCAPEVLAAVKAELATPLLAVHPYAVRTAGIVVTGREVYEGRIKDGFIPRLSGTLEGYGVQVTESVIVPDEVTMIAEKVAHCAATCDIVLVTGGTSVDPDDVTLLALEEARVEFLNRGMPMQPGNNFTIGYLEGVAVCAVPAATLFFDRTSFDHYLPGLLAGLRPSLEDIHQAGHGGLLPHGRPATRV